MNINTDNEYKCFNKVTYLHQIKIYNHYPWTVGVDNTKMSTSQYYLDGNSSRGLLSVLCKNILNKVTFFFEYCLTDYIFELLNS